MTPGSSRDRQEGARARPHAESDDPRRARELLPRVPVIAVTGHLGAGKTTVVNHLLRRPGARLGVVVNDFGELNVDAALVTGQIDEVAAISGGCLCCLPDAGGLDAALQRLAAPRLRLDAILVEASGAAEPIALSRLIRYSGVGRVRPGGVIEVVDAREHFRTVDTHPDPPARYAAATLVVVGKADLLPAGERDAVIARIRERVGRRNLRAPVIVAAHGRIDPGLVFDAAEDEEPADELPLARLLREEANHRHGHAHAQAASAPLPHRVSPTALVDLLEDPPVGAYRMKGRVRVLGARAERGYLVNLVGTTIHIAPLPAPPPVGELVAIGMRLEADRARERLETVAGSPAERPDPAGRRRLRRYRRLSD
jgi:G3E family GTPase